ncbi:tRNA pseudouridine synthase A isoform X2 [Agrilus planipennis]|uniref:Pseudouridylate synthase 1 homolog n=1 Tax=Agrilus planipennis TaxID=224129 RepID=A0A1W4W6K1_AGRPL|nr:tRNA pseudouridine synthase A isoform X2 [Agrilus planipennis]
MIRILQNCLLKHNPLESLKSMSTTLEIKKPRYNGKTKKRRWEERRSDKGEGLYSEKKTKTDEPFVRIKRRKYAMLLGYSGADYFGMQRNPFSKTIEEDLCKALLKAELITDEAYNQMQTIQFQRAARTDKGVSAARQVVSLKLPETVDLDKVNSFLPETIRVFAAKRVTKGFNSKAQCSARTYMYMLPSVALSNSTIPLNQEGYHLSDERHSAVNALLKQFEGTHNYHSYTNKKKANDPSAKRYIMSFYCEKPFTREGMEFVVLKVKGQSFMLHQIRKMVGITVAVLRGYVTQEILDKSFTIEKVWNRWHS